MNSSGDPKQKMRAETVAMLRAVLISSPLGVRFAKLYKDYKQLTGKTIPYKELGFSKLESFIQSIPDVARAEKGVDGEWTLKGVACESDKHVAKLISKQKKPKIRKSAKLMLSRKANRFTAPPGRYNSPVKHPPRQPLNMANTQRFMPPRMQKLQKTQQGRGAGRTVTLNIPDLRQKLGGGGRVEGTFGGALFQRTTDNIRASRTNTRTTGVRTVAYRSNSSPNQQEKGSSKDGSGAVYQPMSVSISNTNTNTGRSVRAVTTTSPVQHSSSGALNDPALVKWIKGEISKTPNGLWATRLVVLYQEKFKKALGDSTVKELKYRPDIARVEEPIDGRYLLYAAKSNEKVQRVDVRNVAVQASIEPKRPSPPKQILDITLPYDFPDVGSCCTVYITHVQNVDRFHVSKTDAISDSLNEELLEHYESSIPNPDAIPAVMPDQIFCAQFSEDQCFYRARVLEVVDHKHVRVLYVDFGNQEVIEVKSLRILAEQFHSQPVQAFQCYIDGVQPANEDQNWNEAASSKFSELTYDKALKMTVNDIEDTTLRVILYDESLMMDIGDELIKAGVATSTANLASTPSSSSSSLSSSTGATSENITPPKKESISRSRRIKPKSPGTVEVPDDPFIDVLVCNITGTFNIYLRLVGDEYSKKFESIQESMTCYYGASKDEVTTEPAVGDLFALLSDEVWCRVKVVSISGETIHVLFVDHGDEVNTSKAELRMLATQFQQLPFQVFRCALNGLPKTKNPDVVDKLQKLVMGEVCVAEVFEKSADLVFVELIDTRSDANIVVNDVIRTLVMPDEELKPVLPKVGKTIEVDVPYVSPSGSVFLHVLAAGTKRLDELNKDLTEHYIAKRSKANEFVPDPSVGKVCCAKCDEDGNWYRVKIISASNRNAVEVMYVDYGNTDTVPSTNLREPTQANEHVLSLPFQALECQLYDVPKSDWNEDLANRIMEIIAQGTVIVEVLSDGNPPSVSLLVTILGKDDEASTQRLTTLLGITFEDGLLEQDVDSLIVNNGETTINAVDERAQITANGNEKIVEENGKSAVATNETVSVEESGIVAVEESEKVSIEESEKYIVEENGENVFGDGDKIDADEGGEASAIDDGKADEAGKAPIGEEKMAVNQANANVNGVHCVQESGDDSFEGEVVEEVAEVPFAWKELPLDSGWMDVIVTDVKDLDNFTFQLLPNLEEFDKMATEMNDYYQKSTTPTETTPVDGGVYAVFNEKDECWYRGMVESLVNNDKACVLLVDYGGDTLIGEQDIRLLKKQFLELPFQGVQASLAGIKHTGKKWSRACIKDFKFNTFDRDLVAKVTSGDTSYRFSPKSRVLVELYDTLDPSQDILIAEKIIANHSDALSIT